MSELAERGNIPQIIAIEKYFKDNYNQEVLSTFAPVGHYQIPGVYVRSLFIPAGMALTGKVHNYASVAILAQGKLRITNGDSSMIIEAPYISVDGPGTMRMGYAETDCTFITIHRTDNTDIAAIEDELASDTFDEFERKTGAKLGEQSCPLLDH